MTVAALLATLALFVTDGRDLATLQPHYLAVHPADVVALEIVPLGGAWGHYDAARDVVQLDPSVLQDPRLAAHVAAHEVGHRLYGPDEHQAEAYACERVPHQLCATLPLIP